jgi:hypothetical protein
MLAVPVAAVILAVGAPPPAAAQQANRSIQRALAHQLAALRTPGAAEKHLFAADSVLHDAQAILESYEYGKRPSPLSDVGLAVVADHVALAKTDGLRRAWIVKTIAHTRAALEHLRPFR